MQITRSTGSGLLSGLLVLAIETSSACSLMSTDRLLYDQQDIRIGVETDPTLSRAQHSVSNSHPAELTAEEIQSLLQVLQVSGWSGTIAGILGTPRPVSLFKPSELANIAPVLVKALHEAKPTERVYFSLPKLDVTYNEDRTAGSLFLRGRYLHVVVTDHSAFMQADTAGGDLKDLRDTKGMALWVASPAQAATVPDADEPRWAPFETVHISLSVKEVLARQTKAPAVRASREDMASPSVPSSVQKNQAGVSPEDLQLQIRELTTSNQELRSRLEEQNKRTQMLMDDMEQVRRELDKAKSKKPLPRKAPSP